MADGNILSRAFQAVRYTISGVTPQTWMSPQQPLPPQAQQAIGRQNDYAVAYNVQFLPRSERRVKFATLKALSRNCGVLRTVIERQKDLLESFDWNVKPRDASGKKAQSQSNTSILAIEAFLRYPDQIHDWAQWLRALLEQVFVYDALALYRRRDMGGRPFAFELIDGSTIKPLIDGSGRRPFAPDPAYQQRLKGIAAVDYSTDELLYWPKNVSVDDPYGYPPVEQIIDYVETAIQRTNSQKAYFTEGNLVDGLFSGPVEWKSEQIKAWQGYWDSLFSGNVAMRRKGFWVPNGTTFTALKQAPLKDDFDEWLARVICFAFSTSPQPFIKQVARGNQESQQEVAEEGGVATYMAFIKRLIDRLLAEDFSRPDLEFVWSEDREFDPLVATQINDIRLRNGSLVIDEVRDRSGEDPLPNGLGKAPLIYTASGATKLEDVLDPPDPPPVVMAHPALPAPGDPKETPPADKPANAKAVTKRAPGRKVTSPSADRPLAQRTKTKLAKALHPILMKASGHVADEVKTRLMAMGKAADDSGDALKRAKLIAGAVNLQALEALSDPLIDGLVGVAEDSADTVVAQIGASADGLTDQVFERAVAWAKARAGELVSVDGDDSLVASTRNMIREVIAQGLSDNLGAAGIADKVAESQAFSPERAANIANTEVGNANSGGALEGLRIARDLGVRVKKTWETSGGEACCDECEANEAEGPIEIDDTFPSGDDAPLAHPGCNCLLGSEIEDGEE